MVADRARTLAWLIGAEVDTGQLAARLAFPALPHPLAGDAMWRGVHAVMPTQALHLKRDGSYRAGTWWQAPPAELPLAEGASMLRGALRDAVALRVRPGEVLGADLSGGMDSTSVCFLAAEAGAQLVTATLHWTDPGNEDHAYAQHAAEHLPVVERLVFASAELPGHFSGLQVRHDRPTSPRPWSGTGHSGSSWPRRCGPEAQYVACAGTAATMSCCLPSCMCIPCCAAGRGWRYGTQPGGEHVLAGGWGPPRACCSTTAPTPAGWPPRAAGCVNPRLRVRYRRDGVSSRTFPRGPASRPTSCFSGLLRTAAEWAAPLAADRGQHAWIHQVQEAGRIAGRIEHSSTAAGLVVDSPFCDDAVVAAALAVRPDQARSPWSYKPLLATAMDGLVPTRVLRRTTKDHCYQEWHAGLRAHRRELADWAQDSHLVAAGLAEETELRRALLSPGMLRGGVTELEKTLGAEAWLRDLAAHPIPSYLAQPRGAPR